MVPAGSSLSPEGEEWRISLGLSMQASAEDKKGGVSHAATISYQGTLAPPTGLSPFPTQEAKQPFLLGLSDLDDASCGSLCSVLFSVRPSPWTSPGLCHSSSSWVSPLGPFLPSSPLSGNLSQCSPCFFSLQHSKLGSLPSSRLLDLSYPRPQPPPPPQTPWPPLRALFPKSPPVSPTAGTFLSSL